MRALFRCDASVDIGTGHVMRCLTFADTLRWAGWRCAFLVNAEAGEVAPALRRSEVDIVESADAPFALAVVDHYRLDADYEQKLAGTGARIVVFDDLADRSHACAVLVDPTPGRGPREYSRLVSADTRMLLGPQHAMISERWRMRRVTTLARLAQGNAANRIFVSMGGVDSTNATSRVLDAIAAAGLDVYVDVVLGARAPHLREVTVRQDDRVAVHVDHPDLAALAAEADLAVGAGGTSSFERAVLGLPSIIVGVADNQLGLSAAFAEAGAAEVVPSDMVTNATAFGERVRALAGDGERRKTMSKQAAAMTDGRGALRLLAAVAGTCEARDGKTVRLRLAESKDVDWLLDLQRQEATRRFARNPCIPDAAEHATWFASMLADSARLLTVITIDDEACGMLRLDRLTGTDPAFEISIAVDGQCHRSGVGRAALKLARQLAPGADLLATVKPENAASLALFAGAGYAHESGDLYRCRAA